MWQHHASQGCRLFSTREGWMLEGLPGDAERLPLVRLTSLKPGDMLGIYEAVPGGCRPCDMSYRGDGALWSLRR